VFDKETSVYRVVDDETILASGSFPSDPVKVSYADGFFSVEYVMTGTGTAKIEYLISSNKAGPFITPASASDIATGITVGSDIVSFAPELGKWMKIKVTETGGANPVTITVKLMVQ
jgi:hypothetical protein